jgi:PAS domain-containing protein
VSFVELSIPDPGFKGRPRFDSSLDLWGHTAQQAQEPCLVLDVNAVVVAASPGCGELFAFTATDAVGRRLIDVLRLLDFNAVSGELPGWEVDKIPPLLAITAGRHRRRDLGPVARRRPGGRFADLLRAGRPLTSSARSLSRCKVHIDLCRHVVVI